MTDDRFSLATKWSRMDPNPLTSSYVVDLLGRAKKGDVDASTEIDRLFPRDGSRIGFGTAGLRSAMSPGPLGMNDLVVIQTTQGLARYCQWARASSGGPYADKEKLLAVIGFDHRCQLDFGLSSRRFAMLTKLVFLECGMNCVLLDCSEAGYVHTPLVSYATIKLHASVGVMVTASHNPKADDGYKVFWSDGVQIRPPLDSGIASFIVKEENLVPWTDYGRLLEERRRPYPEDLCLGLGDRQKTMELADAYFHRILKSGLVTGQSNLLKDDNWTPPKIAYTAMHGVGHQWAIKSFETFELLPFRSVPSQEAPDPEFPTVPFPNPEEKGALDNAMEYSVENGCNIVFANDPDADRLAVAERCSDTGVWTIFHGDQIGSLLGHWLWEKIGKDDPKGIAMVASTVSSSMLSTIANIEGFHFEDTLAGFKWIGSRALSLGEEGYRAIFGYEEAIGFSYPDIVPDKDGISSLGIMAELIYSVYHGGKTLAQHMQHMYDTYGEFVSNNGYYFCYDRTVVRDIFDKFRNGGSYPTMVGGYEIESIRDLGEPGYDSSTLDKKPRLPTSKSSPMMTLRFSNGCVAQFRASGTEPKFKYYVEIRGQPGVGRDKVKEELKKMCDVLLEELLQPEKNGLVKS